MASSSESSDQAREHSSFQDWMNLQELDFSELLQALNTEANGGNKEDMLRQLIEKNIKQDEEYSDQRIRLARDDASPFFAPTWCSSLESSLLWLAGCRPTLFIRLVYELCGLQIGSQLDGTLQGVRTGNLGALVLSANQLMMIDNLQGRTIKEEQKLSDRNASLQESIADQPIAKIAKGRSVIYSEPDREADDALIEHEKSMVTIMEEADKLRLNTLREMINILTPFQAVDFLAASKKLHFCIHKWGIKRDQTHGRN